MKRLIVQRAVRGVRRACMHIIERQIRLLLTLIYQCIDMKLNNIDPLVKHSPSTRKKQHTIETYVCVS